MTELRLERKFNADPQTVFAFISQSRHLLQWWGPEGMTIGDHSLDLTKTGNWSSVMINADGKKFKVTGIVLAVDEPNSVEFTWAWHDENDARGHDTKVRFEVSADSTGGSNFTLIHSGLADEDSASNHEMGWTSSLRKLERMDK